MGPGGSVVLHACHGNRLLKHKRGMQSVSRTATSRMWRVVTSPLPVYRRRCDQPLHLCVPPCASSESLTRRAPRCVLPLPPPRVIAPPFPFLLHSQRRRRLLRLVFMPKSAAHTHVAHQRSCSTCSLSESFTREFDPPNLVALALKSILPR